MKITCDFEGGNIVVREMDGDRVSLACDLRDTDGDWFYWAFRVQGAAGRTVTFDFSPKTWVGPCGAAVSHDMKNWAWGGQTSEDDTSFTYTFAPDEDDAYLFHDIPYSTARFHAFAERAQLNVTELCKSEKGVSVPMVTVGEGDVSCLLTSRHHCCESTGTYVMEGMLEEFTANPLPGVKVLAIPFVDIDGAMAGDQGKNRHPHDHNRDYIDEPLYASIRAIQELAQKEKLVYVLDLHAPWQTDRVAFMVRKNPDMRPGQVRFSEILERCCKEDAEAFQYFRGHDMESGQDWNVDGENPTSCSGVFARKDGMRLCLGAETTYYGSEDNPVTQARLVRYGHCMARALRAYHEEYERG